MSILQNIQSAVSNCGIILGEGKYPETTDTCGKIVFDGEEDSKIFFDGNTIFYETFKIVFRGNDYAVLEQKAATVRTSLKSAGFIPVGCYEDVEPKDGEAYLQLSVKFKSIRQN